MLSPEVLECLRCPSCGSTQLAHAVFREQSPTDIVDGVLWCRDCSHWYPIEDRLLDFLVGPLAYGDDRSRFWDKHQDRLAALGLDLRSVSGTTSKDQQKQQQDHFDWYADNTKQSYVGVGLVVPVQTRGQGHAMVLAGGGHRYGLLVRARCAVDVPRAWPSACGGRHLAARGRTHGHAGHFGRRVSHRGRARGRTHRSGREHDAKTRHSLTSTTFVGFTADNA